MGGSEARFGAHMGNSSPPRVRRIIGVLALALVAQVWLASTATAAEPAPPTSKSGWLGAGAPPAPGGYLTIQFGRSMWTATDARCNLVPGALNLGAVAQDLKSRGMVATGTVVVDRTLEAGQQCYHSSLYSGWPDLASLRDTYGWTFVSDGLTHNDITKMTPAQQQQDSCGSLPTFTSHGHNSAWGLFAYGDNHFNTTVQQNIVRTCFAYGRTYKGGTNVRSSMGAPWFQATNSITGGSCNQVAQPCYTQGGSKHYMSRVSLATLAQVSPDRWVDLQFYRLVTGSSNVPGAAWDCTSSDWTLHWTGAYEMYCANDFDWILSQVPAGVVVTDPATVATAWGRSPG